MKTVCETNKCAGCMACVNKCASNAISIVDEIKFYNAVIDETKCVKCGICEKVCPQKNITIKNKTIQWYQGWADNKDIRRQSSSGGAAACFAKTFIENGGYVCSCLFENGNFGFRISDSIEVIRKMSGSKYVKSNPNDIYQQITSYLRDGKRVLFIGLPCQVAGLKNFVGNIANDNLYTVDLICHGTPSPKVLEVFLKEKDIDINSIDNITFRSVNGMGISIPDKEVSIDGTVDAYLLSFLNALIYTENCYSCNYASPNRVSDITIGDNWGTNLDDELPRGISLILANSEKGKKLVLESEMVLRSVDVDRAIAANGQLREPSGVPSKRELFMDGIMEGKKYNYMVLKALPKQSIRQMIKKYAIKLHLKKMPEV